MSIVRWNLKEAGCEEHTNSRANLWSDEQKSHIRLCIKNTEYGFSSEYRENDIARRCAPTAYAVAQGAYTDYMYMTKDGENTCCWWLRSPGDGAIFAAAVVGYGGGAGGVGSYVFSEGNSVRPAIYVSLK